MLRITEWEKWQARALEEIRRKRTLRNTDPSRPYLMPYFAAASQLGPDFRTFAELVGGRQAETFWWRCLSYTAQHAPLGGCRGPLLGGSAGTSRDASTPSSADASRAPLGGGLLVDRAAFGQLVLSRTYDRVSRRVGETVYDALVGSTMCVRVDPDTLYDLPPTTEMPIGRSAPSRTRPGRKDPPVRDKSRRDGDVIDHPSSLIRIQDGRPPELADWCGRCVEGFRQDLNEGRGGCCRDCQMGRRRAAKFAPGFQLEREEDRMKKEREEDLRELVDEEEKAPEEGPKPIKDVLRNVIPKKFLQSEPGEEDS